MAAIRASLSNEIGSIVRNFKPFPAERVPRGCLFTPLLNKQELVSQHPLDTELDKYKSILNNQVIPDCRHIAPSLPNYGQRIVEALEYSCPAFYNCWNFGVELAFRLVAPKDLQTEQNLNLARILRSAMDITFTMSAVIDDVFDKSDTRKSKPAWYKICNGGEFCALYDGMVMGYIPFYLTKKYFKDHPGYAKMVEVFAKANYNMIIGETIDILNHQNPEPDLQSSKEILQFKAGHFVEVQPTLGLLLANVFDEDIHNQVEAIFHACGVLIQTWDDFNDYYSTPIQTGKPSCDFYNGGVSWVSSTALEHFSPNQKELFKECYGSTDPKKVEVVKYLYDEIQIPTLYIEHMCKEYDKILDMIVKLPNPQLQALGFSELDWLIGGCRDYCPQRSNRSEPLLKLLP